MELIPGVYETLVNSALQRQLAEFAEDQFLIKKETIDSADSCKMLADYLSEIVCGILKGYFRTHDSHETISAQVSVINRVLRFIEEEWQTEDVVTSDFRLSEEGQHEFLRGIYSKVGYTEAQIEEKAKCHPLSGYRVSNLFTGGNDISIDDEIKRDVRTADEIDLVVSFIKFQGLRLVYDDLREFIERPGTRLRVMTTTYMGATDPKALSKIFELKQFGNVEIKASFNSNQERLHAKAYIFKRNNGFDTAYIGSSNLSRSALTKGLEWNMRITSVENKHIISKTKATFETYWNSDDFISINNTDDLLLFEDAILRERYKSKRSDDNLMPHIVRFERKTHQLKVLEKLQHERNHVHSFKNLIIAATGTGKTAISAFDFKDFDKLTVRNKGRKARLLFIAHREKILRQSRDTYRSVMVDANFGEIWTGYTAPGSRGNLDRLFITIQTINNHWEDTFQRLGADYYDYIVIDEVHHSAAGSYREVFNKFSPEIFVGLTATPERMDGKEIKSDFNNRFAAEIRLQEALNQRLLCPFDYFCITDNTLDLRTVPCRGDAYDKAMLNFLIKETNKGRFELIESALQRYLTDPHDCKAVCFCAGIEHAETMAQTLNDAGYKALSVTSSNSSELDVVSGRLARGEINYLCVADMLNEGVDIPEIDTILFLRPTESLTIFLQQLGRGLRLADGKTCLTVLDFVAQANKSYNYERRFRALVGKSTRSISEEIKHGFRFLPHGCSITMEREAQEYILRNINEAIFNIRRLTAEVRAFERNTGQELTLRNFLDNFGLDIRAIYKTPGSWCRLKSRAGVSVHHSWQANSKYVELIEGGLKRLFHTNSYEYLMFIKKLMDRGFNYTPVSPREMKFAKMFYYTFWLDPIDKIDRVHNKDFNDITEAISSLGNEEWIVEDLQTLVELKMQSLETTTHWINVAKAGEIELYGCYSADEIHLLLEDKIGRFQVFGTQYNHDHKFAMVFVTLNKSDKEYSPSTQYEDYAISQSQFHWQSMNKTKIDSQEGQQLIHQRENGWQYILFVRDSKKDEYDITNGYYCLGTMDFNSSHGECPMNVIWDMHEPIPALILETAKAI